VGQDDDGDRYKDFLRTAVPLYLPTAPVGRIVSARLEKYRSLTEEWLARHGVQYHSLHLVDLPTRKDRERTRAHIALKARVYRNTESSPLFVESSEQQAIEIAERTGKPVLSIETMRVHHGTAIYANNLRPIMSGKIAIAKRRTKAYLKRTLPPPVIDTARTIKRRVTAIIKR
jgi:uncharacterized HAD superfamily protein